MSAAGCSDSDTSKSATPSAPPEAALAALSQATSCDDLLIRIQDDAIAKLKLSIEQTKRNGAGDDIDEERDVGDDDIATSADAVGDDDDSEPSPPPTSASRPSANASGSRADVDSVTPPSPSGDPAGGPANGGSSRGAGTPGTASQQDSASAGASAGPVAASDTNRQAHDVDEADIVKVVQSGRGIFLLHGNTLRKLSSWPAAETKLTGAPLTIEGQPSEMFVSDAGRAVVFSSVSYASASAGGPLNAECAARGCKPQRPNSGGVKVTVANVAGDTPVVERELYYEGSYVSSRRYASQGSDVVRAVVQANTRFHGLFRPEVEWYDAWGTSFDEEAIDAQLAAWEARTIASIRRTKLSDWLPDASEKKNGKFETLPSVCGSYYVPTAGLADYGLTHVLAIDALHPEQPVGGVTILGATSTVYSNAQNLVLAQPDHRWSAVGSDFYVLAEQQTALHLFELSGAGTTYRASGWVPGHLPLRNPQFGIDVKDGVLRLATTGQVRSGPQRAPIDPRFSARSETRNLVVTARVEGNRLSVIGKTPPLGHKGESVYSSRFLGDRGYLVTFRQTDPLIAVDLANPASPTVLGELEIPGFSEYVHPLDANHLITVGQSATRGIQLQLFDVADAKNIPLPKVLDFGSGTRSEVSYQHKAFTFFDGILAIPLAGLNASAGRYGSALQLVRVDANAGFTHLGAIDHARLYADNGAGVQCGTCDATGCYNYRCGYVPEVRRGVFVKGESATYVYSFSHAGVLVSDLANLAQPIASVGLPAPEGPFGVRPPPGAVRRDAGTAIRPPPVLDASVAPTWMDGGLAPVATSDAAPDGGVARDGG